MSSCVVMGVWQASTVIICLNSDLQLRTSGLKHVLFYTTLYYTTTIFVVFQNAVFKILVIKNIPL